MSWKKTFLFLGIFLLVLLIPFVLVSNPMMDVYKDRVDGNPKTSFNQWLALRSGAICYRTLRPERAADFYRKFLENNADDGRYPDAWIRYAQALEDSHQNQLAEEQYQLFLDTYGENAQMSESLNEARRGLLRVRYQKRK